MGSRRQRIIAQSITRAILHAQLPAGFFARIPSIFYIYWLRLECLRDDLFAALHVAWQLSPSDYHASFSSENALQPMAEMGYSGSTFFTTSDCKYLIKSVPRRFEHTFFRDDMLLPYADHMRNNPQSLLIRITDFLQCEQYSIGFIFGLAPSHHIVMENIKHTEQESAHAWESWDLKPMSYFYPERDVAGGVLTSEATKSKLADDFNDRIVLSLHQAETLKYQLQKDTRLLANGNAVDYSLFLVRIPTPFELSDAGQSDWRTGVKSADGKYVYRAALLDFFWATHKVHARAMTSLINGYNLIDDHGPMSVTTTAPEYRMRFLKMCEEIVEVH